MTPVCLETPTIGKLCWLCLQIHSYAQNPLLASPSFPPGPSIIILLLFHLFHPFFSCSQRDPFKMSVRPWLSAHTLQCSHVTQSKGESHVVACKVPSTLTSAHHFLTDLLRFPSQHCVAKLASLLFLKPPSKSLLSTSAVSRLLKHFSPSLFPTRTARLTPPLFHSFMALFTSLFPGRPSATDRFKITTSPAHL